MNWALEFCQLFFWVATLKDKDYNHLPDRQEKTWLHSIMYASWQRCVVNTVNHFKWKKQGSLDSKLRRSSLTPNNEAFCCAEIKLQSDCGSEQVSASSANISQPTGKTCIQHNVFTMIAVSSWVIILHTVCAVYGACLTSDIAFSPSMHVERCTTHCSTHCLLTLNVCWSLWQMKENSISA